LIHLIKDKNGFPLGKVYPHYQTIKRKSTMKEKKSKVSVIEKKDIKNETAELNGVKVNPEDFEMPRTTIEMLEQTFQIA